MAIPTTCRVCGARVRAARDTEDNALALDFEPDLFIPGIDDPSDAFVAVPARAPSTVETVQPLQAAVERQVYKRHNCLD